VEQSIRIQTEIPGPISRAWIARKEAVVANAKTLVVPIFVERASGATLTDVDGNTFLDFIGGIAVGALGHSHPTWVDAIQKQAAKSAVGSLTSEARVELFGHRGASALRPEHTLASYARAIADGADSVDLEYSIPVSAPTTMTRIRDLLVDVYDLFSSEHLLALQPPQVLMDLQDWYFSEFGRQARGEEPTRWAGPTSMPS